VLVVWAAASGCARKETIAPLARAEPAGEPRVDARTGTTASPRLVDGSQPVPKGGGVYKLGSPYRVGGRWYVPKHEPGYDRDGVASFYAEDFHGRRTANGEIFDMGALTAAHPTLPLPSYVHVTNLENGRAVLVRINDRGPYAHDRIIDLSRFVASRLGFERAGTARVRVRYAGAAPLDGNDAHERRFLAAQPWARLAGDPLAPVAGLGAGAAQRPAGLP
jgi:rare lipoprotein A